VKTFLALTYLTVPRQMPGLPLIPAVALVMGVRRNFSREGNIHILLIFFKLLTMQCKWTLTKHF